MDKLKELFGTEALTYEQLSEKLKDNKDVKLANLASGEYVSKKKYDDISAEYSTAQNTLKDLQEKVKSFDGVDVEQLKKDAETSKSAYEAELAKVKLDSALDLALMGAKVKNPKLAKAGLDMSIIKLDGDELTGLKEQIDKLRESDGYLFEDTDTSKSGVKVDTGASHNSETKSDAFLSALMQGAGLETKGDN